MEVLTCVEVPLNMALKSACSVPNLTLIMKKLASKNVPSKHHKRLQLCLWLERTKNTDKCQSVLTIQQIHELFLRL